MLLIPHEIASKISFDLAAEVAAYTQALEDHRFTVDVPRPTSHPLVEEVVKHGGTFEVLPPEPEPEAPVPPTPPIPPTPVVTMAQARIALTTAGLFNTIDAGLQALPEPQRTVALIAWEYAPTVSRTGALVTTLSKQFGMTEKQLDDLFTAAAAIEL